MTTKSMLKALLATVFSVSAYQTAYAQCQADTDAWAELIQSKEANFAPLPDSDLHTAAILLIDCLNHPDPMVRDGTAYEGLTTIFRSARLDADQTRQLGDRLIDLIRREDPNGFGPPFAALVLSEFARTDRVDPWLTDSERTEMVTTAATYLTSVDDYRGFSDEEGWRHGIAHGADWLMQLALNPALTHDQHSIILDAVQSQVSARNGHAYIYGEPERLARPVFFIAVAGTQTESEWSEWFGALTDPAPMTEWTQAYQSEAGLARLHNIKAFLSAIHTGALMSANDAVKVMVGPTEAALRRLP